MALDCRTHSDCLMARVSRHGMRIVRTCDYLGARKLQLTCSNERATLASQFGQVIKICLEFGCSQDCLLVWITSCRKCRTWAAHNEYAQQQYPTRRSISFIVHRSSETPRATNELSRCRLATLLALVSIDSLDSRPNEWQEPVIMLALDGLSVSYCMVEADRCLDVRAIGTNSNRLSSIKFKNLIVSATMILCPVREVPVREVRAR